MNQVSSEIIASDILLWLLSNDDLAPVFLGSTGISPAEIAEQAGDPAFLGAVIDFILQDDAWVVAACDAVSLAYENLIKVRHQLPGADVAHWT